MIWAFPREKPVLQESVASETCQFKLTLEQTSAAITTNILHVGIRILRIGGFHGYSIDSIPFLLVK